MKKYLPTKNNTLNDDLFDQWEQELILRHQLRASSAEAVTPPIVTERELETLWRALYFSGQKDIFWSIIMENLYLSQVLNWLTADDNRLDEFLSYLPAYLLQKKPEHKRLQYLINLFSEKFNDRFIAIFSILDAEACSFLVSRSANPQFRKLLNERLRFLQEKKSVFFYGLDEMITNNSLPTIHGDKIKLLAAGIELLQVNLEENIDLERSYNITLEAAEIFFRAGMVADSLALLIKLVSHKDFNLSENIIASGNKQFEKLLRKVTAVFCLIYKPELTGANYKGIYHDYFPEQQPDYVTLKYFAVYDLLKLARQSETIYTLYHIAYEAEQISLHRNSEYLLLNKADLDNGLSEPRINELKLMVEQKLLSLPHEAFITIQLLHLLLEKNLVDASLLAGFLLDKALMLFKWVPSPLFINSSFLTSLGLLVNDESRYEAERVASDIELYGNSNKASELAQKLELFKNKDAVWLRQITAGKFLGVL